MTEKKITKVTSVIEDDQIIFTVEGYLDEWCDWTVRVQFKTQGFYISDKTWTVKRDNLSEEYEITDLTKDEYMSYIMKYVSTNVTYEEVECEHEECYEIDDFTVECDRCGAVINNLTD